MPDNISNTNEDQKENGLKKFGLSLPPLNPLSEGEKWWIKITNAIQTFSLESSRSYLIPGKDELYYFRYITYWEGEKPSKLGVYASNSAFVFAKITAKFPELEITNVQEIKDDENDSLFVGLPNRFKLSKKYFGYDSKVVNILHSILPDITERYQKREAGTLGRLYLYLLELTAGKEFLPYYEALNPDFFKWCKKAENIRKKSFHFREGKVVEDSK